MVGALQVGVEVPVDAEAAITAVAASRNTRQRAMRMRDMSRPAGHPNRAPLFNLRVCSGKGRATEGLFSSAG